MNTLNLVEKENQFRKEFEIFSYKESRFSKNFCRRQRRSMILSKRRVRYTWTR